MENYFTYFTEIEQHFQKRRGSNLLLSTLDWALIETWKDAGIPLQAVLRGIDEAFDRYQQRPSKIQKINSLAYCSQQVLAASEEMQEARVGAEHRANLSCGFEASELAQFFRRNAARLERAKLSEGGADSVEPIARTCARTLRELATEVENGKTAECLEDLERRMTALEEKLLAALLAATSDQEVVALRLQADSDLAPYRTKMPVLQIERLHRQYLNKRLLEKYDLPRLSLFYL